MPSRSLCTADVTAARLGYEAGERYQPLADRFGVSKSTMIAVLRSVGVSLRPRGRVPRPPGPVLVQPRPVVEIVSDLITGRLRIPMRTAAERRFRAWTAGELAAIDQAVQAGRVLHVPRARSGLPERASIAERDAAHFAFWIALQKFKAAA